MPTRTKCLSGVPLVVLSALAAVLLSGAATARADTPFFSLVASPASVVGAEEVGLTVSGDAGGAVDVVLVRGESCPSSEKAVEAVQVFPPESLGHVVEPGSSPLVASVAAPSQRGVYRFCGYDYSTIAYRAEAPLVVTASPEEVRQARERAEALARPLASLFVGHRIETKAGGSRRAELRIAAAAFGATVVATIRHGSHHWTIHNTQGAFTIVYNWVLPCNGGTYSYVVTARTHVGPTLVRRGHFANPFTPRECSARYD